MKKNTKIPLKILLTIFCLITVSGVFAQLKPYSWDSFKIKFKVPENFVVDEATANTWIGHNSKITLSIYPRKGENLSGESLKTALNNWTVANGVTNLDEGTEIDPEKLNRYNGYLYEGVSNTFLVETMLIVDPDYPGISFYIFIHYKAGSEDDVLNILTSFTPI
ncbi:MAG TPA: hypothetical protein PKN48_13095 [Bacteroidales bacterium]|nr:hypothetical protein [Bacteroidales bacterium]